MSNELEVSVGKSRAGMWRVAGGTEGLLCCPGSRGALTVCRSSRGTGMLVVVWKLFLA